MALKRVLAINLAMLVSVCAVTAQSAASRADIDQTAPGFSILVIAPTSPIKLHASIEMTVTVTNDTTHTIYWESFYTKDPDAKYAGYRYDLEHNGHAVETTFFHRKITGTQRRGDPDEVYSPASSVLIPHSPGKMFELRLDLERLYQIRDPGVYTFQVSRYDQSTRATVHSNKVTFVVQQ